MWTVTIISKFWETAACKKDVLKSFTKFTGKHLFRRLWHRCFPVNFVKLLKTPSVGCLFMLKISVTVIRIYKSSFTKFTVIPKVSVKLLFSVNKITQSIKGFSQPNNFFATSCNVCALSLLTWLRLKRHSTYF